MTLVNEYKTSMEAKAKIANMVAGTITSNERLLLDEIQNKTEELTIHKSM